MATLAQKRRELLSAERETLKANVILRKANTRIAEVIMAHASARGAKKVALTKAAEGLIKAANRASMRYWDAVQRHIHAETAVDTHKVSKSERRK